MAKHLNPRILEILQKRTGKSIGTLRKEVSLAKREFPSATSNAAAQVVARRHKTSVLQKLDVEDRASVPFIGTVPARGEIHERPARSVKRIVNKPQTALFDYDTSDYFRNRHIQELSRANTARCYTCVFILFRKIIENLLIDIIRAKFPGNGKENIDLYYNVVQRRFRDFSEILDSLKTKKSQFGIDGEKVIDRVIQLTKPFKKDANDKTHSWFHVVETQEEIQQIPMQTIVELIKKLEVIVGARISSSKGPT